MFQRMTTQAAGDPFCCCRVNGGKLSTCDECALTRDACNTSNATVAGEASTQNSARSQANKKLRDLIWPTDVFGRIDLSAETAHILPAGPKAGNEWTHVAASVTGTHENSNELIKMKKAARGVLKNKGNTGTKREVTGEDKPKRSRAPGTGVVHFVSNKLRLHDQKKLMDGNEPCMLIVPVVDLEKANKWRGEGHSAIVLIGKPQGFAEPDSRCDGDDDDALAANYKSSGADDTLLMGKNGQGMPKQMKLNLREPCSATASWRLRA